MNDVLIANGSHHAGESTSERHWPRRKRRRSVAKSGAAAPYDALLWRLLSRRVAGDQAGCTIGVVEAGPPNAPREGRGDDVLAENEEMYR